MEKLFWAKWNNLEKLHECLSDTALSIMYQANYKSDDIKERRNIINRLVRDVLRQAMGVSGGYNVYDMHIEGNENRDLRNSLHCLGCIARLYFNVFSDVESGEFEEDLNFANYIIGSFDVQDELQQIYDALSDEEKEESRGEKIAELIENAKKAELEFCEDFIYPEENESPEEYLERVL